MSRAQTMDHVLPFLRPDDEPVAAFDAERPQREWLPLVLLLVGVCGGTLVNRWLGWPEWAGWVPFAAVLLPYSIAWRMWRRRHGCLVTIVVLRTAVVLLERRELLRPRRPTAWAGRWDLAALALRADQEPPWLSVNGTSYVLNRRNLRAARGAAAGLRPFAPPSAA